MPSKFSDPEESGEDSEELDVASVYAALVNSEKVVLPYSADFYRYKEAPGYDSFMEPSISTLKRMLGSLEQYRLKGSKSAAEETADQALTSKPDEHFAWFESLLDDCLERVNTALDSVKRDVPPIHAGESSMPKDSELVPKKANLSKKRLPGWGNFSARFKTEKCRSDYPFGEDKGVKKPQDRYGIAVDNSDSPFQPRLEVLKGLIPSDHTGADAIEDDLVAIVVGQCAHRGSYPHPFQQVQDTLEYKERQLSIDTPAKPRSLEFTKFLMVDTLQGLQTMAEDLACSEEIAVDLEHHDRRTFLGLTCLIQISTRKTDYILDPFPLWKELGPILAPIFADPSIVKVFHGAFNDIIWLQRDFGIYVVNIFDTHEACQVMQTEKKSLAFLMEHYCDIKPDKKYQRADWRLRPLKKEMLLYARLDTHSLLYIYDSLRKELMHLECIPQSKRIPLRDGVPNRGAVVLVLERSRLVALQRYEKPSIDKYLEKAMNSPLVKDFNDKQRCAHKALLEWRFEVARTADESVHFIMSVVSTQKIAARLPEGVVKLRALLSRHEEYAYSNASTILEVIKSSVDEPRAQSGLFTPLPRTPPVLTSVVTKADAPGIFPKPIMAVQEVEKCTFGRMITGDIRSDATGAKLDPTLMAQAIVQPIKQKSANGFHALFASKCNEPTKTPTEEICASFTLPFMKPPVPATEDSVGTTDVPPELAKSTAHDVRDIMEQLRSIDEAEGVAGTIKAQQKSYRIKRTWDDDLKGHIPLSVQQAYSNAKEKDGEMDDGLINLPCEPVLTFEGSMPADGEQGLVEAELRQMREEAVAKVSGNEHKPHRYKEEQTVVPFDYTAANLKKQGKDQPAKEPLGNRWRRDCEPFKKAKRSRQNPKSGNRSSTFSSKR